MCLYVRAVAACGVVTTDYAQRDLLPSIDLVEPTSPTLQTAAVRSSSSDCRLYRND
jgi:hypothetical protein